MSLSSDQGLRRRCFRRIRLAFGLIACSLLWNISAVAQTPPPLNARDMAMTISGDFTVASVGDLMMRRPASQLADADVQAALKLIADADLAVGNMEGELANLKEFEGPLNGFVGTHEVAADLKTIGFDMGAAVGPGQAGDRPVLHLAGQRDAWRPRQFAS